MVTNQISFDVCKSNYIMLYARKGEINARSIVATFLDEDEEELDLSDKSVTFYALKPDGTQIYNNCTIDDEDKTATITLTSQMVSVAGIVNCEYQIYSGNTLLLKVNGLKIVVEDGGDFSEAIESSSEYNVLINAINQAESVSNSLGSFNSLTTTEKSTIVGAINEINGKTIPITQGGTGGITVTEARTNLSVMTGVSLYANSSGTQGTIELSDDYSNYSYIKVEYKDSSGIRNTSVFSPTATQVALLVPYSNSDGTTMFFKTAFATFSYKSVTLGRNGTFSAWVGHDNTNRNGTFNSSAGLSVMKIIGYKY